MRELNAERSVPITVTGTFQRPVLVLTFEGVVYEARAGSGTFRGRRMGMDAADQGALARGGKS